MLLEKLAKSAEYTLHEYVQELRSLLDISNEIGAWESVLDKNLKKSDKKFKVYLGLCESEEENPASSASRPPKLEPVFRRETWLTPGSVVEEYALPEDWLHAL